MSRTTFRAMATNASTRMTAVLVTTVAAAVAMAVARRRALRSGAGALTVSLVSLALLVFGPITAVTSATAATGAAGPAGPELTVHPSTDLTEGTKITVTATGYKPGLQSVAVGLCRAGYQNGLKDCDLGGGATFVNIDARGRLPAVTLTARAKFNRIDCMVRQCVIGAAPLPGTMPHAIIAANTAVMKVGFKGSGFKGGVVAAAPNTVTAAPRRSGDGPSTLLWAVTLGVLVLGGFTIAVVQHRGQSR